MFTPQGGGQMNNHETLPFEDASKIPRPAKFNVAIIYETLADGKRAKRFSDRVAAEVDDGYDMAINMNVWSFQSLKMPEMLFLAASAAAVADVIIVAAAGASPLPAQIKHWITMWSGLLNGKRPLVAGLFANSVEENAPIRAELRKTALRKGLPFYVRTDHEASGIRHGKNFRAERPTRLLEETLSTVGNACSAVVIGTQGAADEFTGATDSLRDPAAAS
jgi:hypothetical protein